MDALNLSTFIKAADDIELSKYKVLSILGNYSGLLHRNKLYPAFAELISIKNELELLLEQMSLFDPEFVLNLNFADFSEELPLTNPVDYDEDALRKVTEFINWALPEIHESIEEGKAIFDFVNENINLNEVGVMPLYNNEGYFFISDIKNELMKIYRFEMSLFSTKENPLRTLKSKLVDLISLKTPVASMPYELKQSTLEKYTALPNPSCYYFETEIEL